MPYWECPRCRSTDSYEGTELQQKVTGSGGGTGVGFVGNPLGNSGITPMVGGSKSIEIGTKTVEATVRKCKKCNTLLGEKDLRLTADEIKQIREEKELRKKEKELRKKEDEALEKRKQKQAQEFREKIRKVTGNRGRYLAGCVFVAQLFYWAFQAYGSIRFSQQFVQQSHFSSSCAPDFQNPRRNSGAYPIGDRF